LTSEADLVRPASRAGQTVTVGGTRFRFEPHNCFACGTLNEHGLRLLLHMEPGRSWTELSLDRRFEGWDGIAHGGVVCTLLDEVMAWALVAEDHWGVTARLSVAFRRPVMIGRPIRAEGWINRSRGRLSETAARIVDADEVELATAEATYVAAGAERRRELQARYGYRTSSTESAATELMG
jgi:acyl-coenzyme A thioesterase PaaI-like protein